MIEVKKIEPPMVDLYAPDDTHLGRLNEYEFLDARVQIKEGNLWGYYLKYGGDIIRIDRKGELEDYPEGLFDQLTNLFLKLI